MATLLRWRSTGLLGVRLGDPSCVERIDALREIDSSLDVSLCSPAFTAAAAAREVVRGVDVGISSGSDVDRDEG